MSWQFPTKPGIGRRSPYPLRRLHLEEGEVVYEKGDPNGELFRVVSGTIHLSAPQRLECSDSIELAAGAIFGDAGLFSGAPRDETAAAATEAVLDVMERDEALKLLERHNESMQELLTGLFDQVEQRLNGPPVKASPGLAADGPDATVDDTQPVRLLLKPSSRPLAAWIGREPIEITQLPFIVGRLGEGEDGNSGEHIDLVLADEKPYQLSRQHFVIDTCDGELVVRDSGSYHGTTVNSRRIGNDRSTNMVPLRLGENRIVAGSADSPYCFTLLIEAA